MYKRNRDEIQRRGGRVDHSQELNRSRNPKYIGEEYMLLMTREESGTRHLTRLKDTRDEHDGIFYEDEEDGD